MCFFSPPKAPALPANPVQQRQDQAQQAADQQKKKLSKSKGGRQFLSNGNGFQGLQDTLLGVSANQL